MTAVINGPASVAAPLILAAFLFVLWCGVFGAVYAAIVRYRERREPSWLRLYPEPIEWAVVSMGRASVAVVAVGLVLCTVDMVRTYLL
jgi:hypothetical protein